MWRLRRLLWRSIGTSRGANGEREADFINCMMWRKQAELFAEWSQKGNLVGVTGRIQTRNYEESGGAQGLSD